MGSGRMKKQVVCLTILLIILGLGGYLHIQHATRLDSNDIRTGHLALAQSMFHPLDIEQLLLPTANEGIVSANEHEYFTSVLTALRRLYHFNLPKCRPNVHFSLLLIYLTKKIPLHLHQFLSTAARNASIDVIIMMSADDCTTLEVQYHDTNIYILCVHREVVFFFITDGLCSEWKCSSPEFHQTFRNIKKQISKIDSRMRDMKPMLGSLFRRYLSCYSHWAFGDSAVWLQNFDDIYSAAIARKYDIITFSYGDDDKIYMREQLTVLKNTQSIVSLWTKMKAFSSQKTFTDMVENQKWNSRTITEGDFSVTIVENRNVKWIQLPGSQIRGEILGRSKIEATIFNDQPPALFVRTNDETDDGNSYTKMDKTQLSKMKEVALLKATACGKRASLPVNKQRCISTTKPLSPERGTVIMCSDNPTKVLTRTVAISTKISSLIDFSRSRQALGHSLIPITNISRMSFVNAVKRNK